MKNRINLDAVHAQLCNSLELERCAIRVYEQTLRFAANPRLHARWRDALDEARRNEASIATILVDLGLDADCESPQRRAVRCVGESLLQAMRQARSHAERERLAQDCVKLVEERERSNWELLGQLLSIGAGGTTRAQRLPRSAANDARPHDWYGRALQARVEPGPRQQVA